MNQASPSAFLLFELLARRWAVPAPAVGLTFNRTQTRLAAPLADGSIALVDCADREPPESRIAVDDARRKTIAPRRLDAPPATIVSAQGPAPARLCCGSGEDFVAAWDDASLWRLHAQGTIAALSPSADAPLVALDRCERTTTTLVATSATVILRSDAGVESRAAAPSGLRSAALAPDGATLAYGVVHALLLAPATAPSEIAHRFETPGGVNRIAWSEDGHFLCAACEGKTLALLDATRLRLGLLTNFTEAPNAIAWSGPARALVVSGAYRIAAWSIDHPPFDGDHSGALETGRPGMVAVDQVATHPNRRFVAAASGNGAVVLAEIGRRDELPLRGSGPKVRALSWSDDGRLLAIADQEAVSLVSLPDILFKQGDSPNVG